MSASEEFEKWMHDESTDDNSGSYRCDLEDAFNAGLEAAAKVCEAWAEDDKCIQPSFLPMAKAIRKLKE